MLFKMFKFFKSLVKSMEKLQQRVDLWRLALGGLPGRHTIDWGAPAERVFNVGYLPGGRRQVSLLQARRLHRGAPPFMAYPWSTLRDSLARLARRVRSARLSSAVALCLFLSWLSVCLSVCPSVHPSVRLSVCLSVCATVPCRPRLPQFYYLVWAIETEGNKKSKRELVADERTAPL
eukprot:8672773-Pyramimonas_sp.AAC.1